MGTPGQDMADRVVTIDEFYVLACLHVRDSTRYQRIFFMPSSVDVIEIYFSLVQVDVVHLYFNPVPEKEFPS